MKETVTRLFDDEPTTARLLVVDDEHLNRDMLARRLERLGHVARVASGGAEALERIAEEEFDLVLLDIQMPLMDGYEVLRRIREHAGPSQLPVIMVTARHDTEDVVAALELGANDYVTKPINYPVLAARVDTQHRLRKTELRLRAMNAALEERVSLRTRELRGAMQQLKLNQERFRILIEHAPAIIYLKDRSGRYELVNRRFSEVYGVEKDDVIGRSLQDLFPGEIAERAIADDLRVIQSGEAYHGEWELPHPDGTTHTYLVSKVPLFGADRAVVGVIGINTDITEYRKLSEDLTQARRLESIGQLTGGVAHDFNNLLTVILSNLQLAQKRAAGNEEALRRIGAAHSAAVRGATLTRQLLAFGRGQVLDPDVIDTPELVQRMHLMLNRTLGGNIDTRMKTDPATCPLRVDPSKLESSLLSLAVNAREAMPGGGELVLGAENVVVHHPLSGVPDEVAAGEFVLLTVRDSGRGIPAELLDKVIEPFFTTKDVGQGPGLGLSMCYGFVRQSGGFLQIDSGQGRGTTVSLYLPRHADGDARAA